MISTKTSIALRASTGVCAVALALLATPSFAQTPAGVTAAETPQADAPEEKVIVVTGSLIRTSSATNSASPVTVITSADIDRRGALTTQSLVQSIASNGGPTLTNSFTANGAFAGGASAASLRSLSTNSTLVLFDGLRAAYYPLADDGSRNFVDLNTIPDEIVDKVEVLRDGASSIYGADAVAGVINIITKKQITGITGTAQAGVTENGYDGNQRLSLTAGYGDLVTQGFNVYVSGHYVHEDPIYSRQLPYPYNSDNQTGICYQGTCGIDNRQNAPSNASTLSTISPILLVRPADATTNAAIPGSRYTFLNPAVGCGSLPSYNPTFAQLNPNNAAGVPTANSVPTTVCTSDSVNQSGQVQPENTKWGVSARATVNIGSNQLYAMFNFEQSESSYHGYGLAGFGVPTNSIIRGNAPAGIYYPRYSTSTAAGAVAPGSAALSLPVYVCPRGTTAACTASNGTLNPNNPYAALGQKALLLGELPNLQQFTSQRSRVYRGAIGASGDIVDGWHYSIDATGMITDLNRHYEGYVYIQHLLDVIADGSYNFVNPYANSAAQNQYLAPTLDSPAQSQVYQVQGNVSHDFFELPGGPLSVAVGAQARWEAIDDPSSNSDFNGPTQRYFVINAFGTKGSRWVESGYGEIRAPILNELIVDLSGRYDHYSTGNSNFSPKVGVAFTPIREIAFRGTWSRGFRIPSFGETASIPTTGYVPFAVTGFPSSYLSQFGAGCASTNATTQAKCSTYVTQATIGETSIANPNLKPEKARTFDAGIDFRPIHNVKISVDYYNIKKTNAITPASYTDVIDGYYANPTGYVPPAGYTLQLNAPDINNPNAPASIFAVGAPYINANTITTDGIDFSLDTNLPIRGDIAWISHGEAEYVHKLNTSFPDGHVEHYAGTLGNFNLTGGTGTPRWKATWQNTIEFGKKGSFTVTAYYVDGYNLSAEDQGDTAGDCGELASPIQSCNVKPFIDVDMNAMINVGERFTFYFNVYNVFKRKASLDTVTYGGYLYNPSQSQAGILGRSYSAGVKVKL